jgi:hypothetical protein
MMKLSKNDVVCDNMKLYFGDCIEKMHLIPDNSVDLILLFLLSRAINKLWKINSNDSNDLIKFINFVLSFMSSASIIMFKHIESVRMSKP